MDVARVDQSHHERRSPGLQVFLIEWLVALRLFGAAKAGRQRKWIIQDGDKAEILGNRLERRASARRRAARQRTAHVAHTSLDARGRPAEHALRLFLHKERAELERYRVEAAGEDDPRAARFRGGFVLADHL